MSRVDFICTGRFTLHHFKGIRSSSICIYIFRQNTLTVTWTEIFQPWSFSMIKSTVMSGILLWLRVLTRRNSSTQLSCFSPTAPISLIKLINLSSLLSSLTSTNEFELVKGQRKAAPSPTRSNSQLAKDNQFWT